LAQWLDVSRWLGVVVIFHADRWLCLSSVVDIDGSVLVDGGGDASHAPVALWAVVAS
jgi:hypothetical protein